MLPEPLRQGLRRALWQERHGLAALQVHQDRAIGVPFPQGEAIHPKHPGRGERRDKACGARAAGCCGSSPRPTRGRAAPQRSPKRPAEGDQALSEPQRAPRPGGRDGGQPFGEDTAAAAAITTKPLADTQLEAHPILRPGQVRQARPRSHYSVDVPKVAHSGQGARGCVDCTRRVICAVSPSTAHASRRSTVASGNKGQDGGGWCRDESGSSIEDVSGATESMCPHSIRLVTHS